MSVEGDCCGELFKILISFVQMVLDFKKCSWQHKNGSIKWKWILDGGLTMWFPVVKKHKLLFLKTKIGLIFASKHGVGTH